MKIFKICRMPFDRLRANGMLVTMTAILFAGTAHAGWKVPITVTAGTVSTNAAIGMEAGATNGYDPGRDVPTPEDTSAITASFSHPEWGVVVAGKSLSDFYQEIKGESYPAEWAMDVDTTLTSSHTITWKPVENAPKGLNLFIYPPSGGKIDMLTTSTYTFTPSSSNRFTIQAFLTGQTPPLSPSVTTARPQDSSLYVEWKGNDPDTAGYKIHFGTQSGSYVRTIDVKSVTNLTINKLKNDTIYYVAVTAYNKTGIESGYSSEAQGTPTAPIQYYAISGKVADSRKKGISGVTVTISTDPPLTTTSDSSGSYTFTGIASGTYTVTPSMGVRDRFSPLKKDVTIDSKDVANINFTLRGRR